MKYRKLGRTGWRVSEISFGAWAIGGSWGDQPDEDSLAALHRALDLGANFFDTADVYGDARSERLMARLRQERPEPFYVATKVGRRLSPHVAEGYNGPEIGSRIGISSKTVETYKQRIAEKIGLGHRADYVKFALTAGLIAAGPSDN